MLPTKLYHYSHLPLEKLTQDFHDKHWAAIPNFGKPYGFWLSVEDFEDDQNWFTWCQGEEFRLEHLKHKYLVKLKKKAKIIYLKTPEEIEEFSLKYKGNDPEEFRDASYMDKLVGYVRKPYIYLIDWFSIMEEYDGIIIAPYQWSCRLMNQTTSWYYGWDCASGCIWNVDAIKSFHLESIQEEIPVNQEEENEKGSQSKVCSLLG